MVALTRHLWSLYGELSLSFPSGAVALGPNILWSTPPIQKSTIESTLVVSPPMPEIICVWQTFDVRLTKTVYKHERMCRQMHRATQRCKALGRVSFCHAAKFWYLHESWFLVFLVLWLSGAGASLLAWCPSSTESGLVDLVGSGSTSLHLLWQWLRWVSELTFGWAVSQQCILLMWCWSGFITTISIHSISTYILL